MAHIRFGFIMPAEFCNPSRIGSYVEDLNRALELISGKLESAWMVDH